ncbi:retrovirus-related pol polyprotein from transposon TNT 1-94 [Tanacetum coccineum]
MAKASPTPAWLWHRRLSHLNFDYINLLSKKDVVIGLPKLKYLKDQLCSSCEVSKAKKSSFKTKNVPSLKGRLNLLHMDLCGPMRVASINGKKCILSIFFSCYLFRNPFSSTTMGDENPIRTLGDYSKLSHEGYRNTIELPVRNNVVPLQSDTIRLLQNGCSFHGLLSEDPNQYLKDFLKLVDSLDLDDENRERTCLHIF